jgi:hypothetical protein
MIISIMMSRKRAIIFIFVQGVVVVLNCLVFRGNWIFRMGELPESGIPSHVFWHGVSIVVWLALLIPVSISVWKQSAKKTGNT